MPSTRLVTVADASALAAAYEANRAFLEPFEPERSASFFTEAGQRLGIEEQLRWCGLGVSEPRVIVEGEGALIGRISLTGIERGAAQCGHLGYWVAQAWNGRGVATAAVAEMVAVAFADLRLHRVMAATLVDNVASQRVLERTGFEPIGVAPDYCRIAGRWQDHVLYQRTDRG